VAVDKGSSTAEIYYHAKIYMLIKRIITALILAPIAIACVFFLPLLQFQAFLVIVLSLAAWEWASLAGYEDAHRVLYAFVMLIFYAASTLVDPLFVLVPGVLWWLVAFVLVLKYPGFTNIWSSKPARSIIGIFMLVPGYVGLVQLKQTADSEFLILLLFFLIWGADIGAYFSGRAFGNKKLAPAVSPGKSWAGVYGGIFFATLVAIGMCIWQGKPELMAPRGIVFILACVAIIMISVLGDLVESMFKRHRGIKDSSALLPGHGGILDRIDSLLSAAPTFALFILIYGWQ
jgi:phosphatidate cytidylyltransferase